MAEQDTRQRDVYQELSALRNRVTHLTNEHSRVQGKISQVEQQIAQCLVTLKEKYEVDTEAAAKGKQEIIAQAILQELDSMDKLLTEAEQKLAEGIGGT